MGAAEGGRGDGLSLSPEAERARRRVLQPWKFRAYLLANLPLAAWAGLRVVSLDGASCTVSLPGGWRTRNPFGSAYFAAQAMAAEMSTGAPALVLVSGAPRSIAFILRGVHAVFTRRIQGHSTFTFADVAGMQAAVERAAAGPEPQTYTGRSIGRGPDGQPAADFEITWSFKRRE